MKELLLNRKLNRFGTILFNIGMFFAILLLSSIAAYVLVVIFWVVAFLIIGVVVVMSFFLILFNDGSRAFIGQIFSAPAQNIATIQLVAKNCAIPFCIVSCLSFIAALVFFFVLPKMKGKTSKIVFCFIGMVVAVVSAFLTYNIAIHG